MTSLRHGEHRSSEFAELGFSYDAIYQLTQTIVNTATTETYTYDQVGNRLSSLGVSPYTYNNSNQLTSLPTVTYTYDNNGNTLTKTDAMGVTTYSWDFENRLASVTLPSSQISNFKYDPFGRRIQKTSPTGTTIYVYDGANIIEELDASGAVLARYTQREGIDEPLAMLRSGTTSYYHADGLGSITSLTDSAGALAASYTYDSFGNAIATTGTVTNPFRYTGRELDVETGLYYYRARYYDQGTGRFLSEDPLRLFGVAAYYATPNFREGSAYSYVLNNPIRLIDPTGLQIRADTPDMRNSTELLEEMAGQGRRRRALGIKDPILDIFTPCFLKCMILGFADDVAIGVSTLASKKVRAALRTPTGLRCAKVGGIVTTAGASVYCARVCAKKVPKCVTCSAEDGE